MFYQHYTPPKRWLWRVSFSHLLAVVLKSKQPPVAVKVILLYFIHVRNTNHYSQARYCRTPSTNCIALFLDRINTRIGVSWILLLHFDPLLKCLPSNLVHMYGSIVLGPCEHGGLSNCNFNEKHDNSSSKFLAHTAPQVRTHQFWCVMVVMMMMTTMTFWDDSTTY